MPESGRLTRRCSRRRERRVAAERQFVMPTHFRGVMRRLFPFALAIIVGCSTGRSGPRTVAMTAAGRTTEESRVIGLSKALWEAQVRRDKGPLDTLISADFRYFSSKWPLSWPKAEELSFRTDSREPLQSFDIQDVRTAWITDSALFLRYFVELRIRTDRGPVCPRRGVIETWRYEHAEWRQTTRTEWLIGSLVSPYCAAP